MNEFLAMGGYGFYVWGAYLVTFVVLVVEILAVRARQRKTVAQAIAAVAPDGTR